MKKCLICKRDILPPEEPHHYEKVEQPIFAHQLCHWKATAGMLAKQLAEIEATIEAGNATVGILAGLLMDLLEYAEMGANWSISNFIETDLKKIDWIKNRISTAKKIVSQFAKDVAKKEDRVHVCTPQCKHD